MFKIIIKYTFAGQDIIVKKKLYESRKSFDKWLTLHSKNYILDFEDGKRIYSVLGYELIDGKWQETS